MPTPRNELWKLVYTHIDDLLERATKKSKEDLFIIPHCQNVLDWGLRIKKSAHTPLKIALFGHDIERAYPDKIIKGNKPYDQYKAEHSKHSADKLEKILKKFDADEELIKEVYILTRYHDVLITDPSEADQNLLDNLGILRDSDAISYFDVQFEKYLKKYKVFRTATKLKWTYDRLTPIAKKRKRADDLYNKRKKELINAFPSYIENLLKKEGIIAIESHLENIYPTLIQIFDENEVNEVYDISMKLIEEYRQKIIEGL